MKNIKPADIKGDYHYELLDAGEPMYSILPRDCIHQMAQVIEKYNVKTGERLFFKATCIDCGYDFSL